MKEYPITQKKDEPPRRYFSDDKHLTLILWYEDEKFENLIGFQLAFRENPYNTDNEYLITLNPNDKVSLGRIKVENKTFSLQKKIVEEEFVFSDKMKSYIVETLSDLPLKEMGFVTKSLKEFLI